MTSPITVGKSPITVRNLELDDQTKIEEALSIGMAKKFVNHTFKRVDGISSLIFFVLGGLYTLISVFTEFMSEGRLLEVLNTDNVVKAFICIPIVLMLLKIIYLMKKHLSAFGFKQVSTGKFIVMSLYLLTLLLMLLLIISGKLKFDRKAVPIGISIMAFFSMVVSNEFVEFRKQKDRNYVDYFIIIGAAFITIDWILRIVSVVLDAYYEKRAITSENAAWYLKLESYSNGFHMTTIFLLLAFPLIQNFLCEVDALFEETTDEQFQILNVLCIIALVFGILAIIMKAEIFSKHISKKISDKFIARLNTLPSYDK
ncbi:hypothetical protein HK407_06g10840 [Ordospora pajunii]|uniref:uncharacterized protein n=1 Tax=Ordospora pajunii TaxID=3039483 RepID=UPI002952813B|nr:uncharacterized protein HK407_06g10840 [Ordospora pajunii]KAH9411254.1 hypothetical protein HK407_06g10840 [Ordospora pajunii]